MPRYVSSQLVRIPTGSTKLKTPLPFSRQSLDETSVNYTDASRIDASRLDSRQNKMQLKGLGSFDKLLRKGQTDKAKQLSVKIAEKLTKNGIFSDQSKSEIAPSEKTTLRSKKTFTEIVAKRIVSKEIQEQLAKEYQPNVPLRKKQYQNGIIETPRARAMSVQINLNRLATASSPNKATRFQALSLIENRQLPNSQSKKDDILSIIRAQKLDIELNQSIVGLTPKKTIDVASRSRPTRNGLEVQMKQLQMQKQKRQLYRSLDADQIKVAKRMDSPTSSPKPVWRMEDHYSQYLIKLQQTSNDIEEAINFTIDDHTEGAKPVDFNDDDPLNVLNIQKLGVRAYEQFLNIVPRNLTDPIRETEQNKFQPKHDNLRQVMREFQAHKAECVQCQNKNHRHLWNKECVEKVWGPQRMKAAKLKAEKQKQKERKKINLAESLKMYREEARKEQFLAKMLDRDFIKEMDQESFDNEFRLKLMKIKQAFIDRKDPSKFDHWKIFDQTLAQLHEDAFKVQEVLQSFEVEERENIWMKIEERYEERRLIHKFLSQNPDLKQFEPFLKRLLMPESLQQEFIKSLPSTVQQITKQLTIMLNRQNALRKQRMGIKIVVQKTRVRNYEEIIQALHPEILVDKRYLDNLVRVRERAVYLNREIKDAFKPRNADCTNDFQIEFIKECNKNQDSIPHPSIGVMPSLVNNSFVLLNTTLTENRAAALANSFQHISEEIYDLCLANNNFSDATFSQFLTKVCDNGKIFNNLRKITYARNEFGPESLSALLWLLQNKQAPFHLTHLTIANCKQRISTIAPLLVTIQKFNKLQVLTIPGQNYANEGFEVLLSLIDTAKDQEESLLKELDISWSIILTHQTPQLFKALANNSKLERLNLAMTSCSEDQNLADLGRFIRKARKLMDLNLSGMFKTPIQVRLIAKWIKKHKTLVSCHLSNTPVIYLDFTLQAYLRQKLNMPQMLPKPVETTQYGVQEINSLVKDDWVLQQKMQNEVNETEKSWALFNEQNCDSISLNKKHDFIIQRVVGYPELAANEKWFVSQECYFCSRWQYTSFMYQWNYDYLAFEDKFDHTEISPFEASKCPFNNPDTKIFVTGSFDSVNMHFRDPQTEWLGFEMQNIIRFAKLSNFENRNREQILEDHKATLTPEEIKAFEEDPQNSWEVVADGLEKQIAERYHYNYLDYVEKAGINGVKAIQPSHIQLTQCNRQLMIYSDFVKPEARVQLLNFVIDKNGIKKQIKQPFVSEVRKNDLPLKQIIPPVAKVVQTEERVFSKDKSVFKNWREDDEGLLNECACNDMKYWKVPKFCKDPIDYMMTENVIKKNYALIKKIFITLIANDEYPNIGWLAFEKFCKRSQFYDKKVDNSVIDRVFIATNFEEDDIEDNPARELCRYEFLEILVRIAEEKYKKTGITEQLYQATEMLIHENMFKNYNPPRWQEFRFDELWRIEPNDVLETNLATLTKLHTMLSFPRGKNNDMAFKRFIGMLTETPVGLSEGNAKFCFAMSKMTVKDESDGGTAKYQGMKLAEFFEYIGRAAHLRYSYPHEVDAPEPVKNALDWIQKVDSNDAVATEGSEKPVVEPEILGMDKKLEMLLDAILPYYDLARKNTALQETVESDSEESLDESMLNKDLRLQELASEEIERIGFLQRK